MSLKPLLAKPLEVVRRLRFYEALLLVFLFILAMGWFLARATETPVFCGLTCHIMRPQYEDWKASSHRDVSCIDCHSAPGSDSLIATRWTALAQVASYLTRTYGEKRVTQVHDDNCLREGCHSRRLLEGITVFKRGIRFDHRPHLQQLRRGKILRCASCHSQVVMGEHITVVEDVCFLCHFKDAPPDSPTADCRLCHDAPSGAVTTAWGEFEHKPFDDRGVGCERCHSDLVRGEGQVKKDACGNCHVLPENLSFSGPVETMHRRHVTDQQVRCGECHEPIEHRQVSGTPLLEEGCDGCHSSRHRGVELFYRGEGATGVEEQPALMYLAQVDCTGCHLLPSTLPGEELSYRGQSLVARAPVCDSCHGEGTGDELARWEEELDLLVEKARRELAAAERQAGEAPPPRALRLLAQARHNLAFLRASSPLHNVPYAKSILARVRADVEEAQSLTR